MKLRAVVERLLGYWRVIASPSRHFSLGFLTVGGFVTLSTWPYHVRSPVEWAMITIQAFGKASYGLGPANTTVPGPAAVIAVYSGAAMSMPR